MFYDETSFMNIIAYRLSSFSHNPKRNESSSGTGHDKNNN